MASQATIDSAEVAIAERVERTAAEMADDRGVGEVVQRLRGDRAESRDRQPRDPPVEIASVLAHACQDISRDLTDFAP